MGKDFWNEHTPNVPDELGADQIVNPDEPQEVPKVQVNVPSEYDDISTENYGASNFGSTEVSQKELPEINYYNSAGLKSDIDGNTITNSDGTYTDKDGHTIMADENGKPIMPQDAPEYYDWYSPASSRNDLVEAIGKKVKPIADVYLNNPITGEIIDKSTQWTEGAKQGYNELIKEGNNIAIHNPLALSGTPMKENVTNAPAPNMTEQQKQDLSRYQKAVNNFINETIKPAAYAAGLAYAPIAAPFWAKDFITSVKEQGIAKTVGDFSGYTAIRNAVENPEELKEKLSTQPMTTVSELFPAYMTGRLAYQGGRHFFARSPKDTTYVNSVLTQQDKHNGYILEERLGVKYRVKRSTKELHPQDKPKFQRRVEDMQKAVEELNETRAAFDEAMVCGAENIKITSEGDLTQKANHTGKISGSSEKASDASKPSLNVNAGTNGTARSPMPIFVFPELDVYAKRIPYTWKFLGVEFSTEDIHQFLDWISWVPGVSVVAGGTDATIYFTEGKHSEALMAALQMIPGSKLLKLGGKAFKVVLPLEKLTALETKIAKGSSKAAEVAGKTGRYTGELVQVNKADTAADLLSQRIGGQARVKFANDSIGREFDVVSSEYIGQTKPALQTLNKSVRDQMKATFEAAQETGKKVYYHFEGQPAQSVIDKLYEYSQRYGIDVIIDVKPLK